jgi:hypothetical protein
MVSIEIRDATATERKALVKGRESVFREQEGWMQLNGETRRVRIPLGRERAAYAAGRYTVDEASFGVNQWNDLMIARLVLKPVAASSAAPRSQAG